LDDGRMTDGQGRTVDFKNTVIVMTSNIGSSIIQGMDQSDYETMKASVLEEVKLTFRPEFVNRIDEIAVFRALGKDQVAGVLKIQLSRLEQRLAKLELGSDVQSEVIAFLSERGYDQNFGARPLKRAIQEYIENPLSKALLNGEFVAGDTIQVGLSQSEVIFTKK